MLFRDLPSVLVQIAVDIKNNEPLLFDIVLVVRYVLEI